MKEWRRCGSQERTVEKGSVRQKCLDRVGWEEEEQKQQLLMNKNKK